MAEFMTENHRDELAADLLARLRTVPGFSSATAVVVHPPAVRSTMWEVLVQYKLGSSALAYLSSIGLMHDQGVSTVMAFDITEALRSRGLGRILHDSIVHVWVRHHNGSRATLRVDPGDARDGATRFWLNRGYKPLCRRNEKPGCVHAGCTAASMHKDGGLLYRNY